MRSKWPWAAAGAVLLAALLVFANAGRHDATPLERAQGLVADGSNFGTGREAGDTMVFAATQLLRQARTCVERQGERPYCLSFRSAAAWSNVAGVKAISCRAPGRFKLQHTAIRYYGRLEHLSIGVADIPRPPPLPDC